MNLTAVLSHPSVAPSMAQAGLSASAVREFLSFKLGAEEYAINIQCVQEIRSYEAATRMANMPAFFKGVVNLRGVIVPILDMRIKFNLATVSYDTFTVVMVVNIGTRVLGLVVDGVTDVITLTTEQLLPVPEFSSVIGSDYLMGIGSVQGRMLVLLDIEKLLTSAEMGLVRQTLQ